MLINIGASKVQLDIFISSMNRDILIIADDLVEPPSETLPFRTLTMFSHDYLEMDVLLHTTQDMKDRYYHWMRRIGAFDYISYILNEWEFEDGIRLDTLGIYPNTIVIKWIRIENQLNILGQIRVFRG